ncbi:amidohydrolase family protein [Kordiimonas sp. SCSIO 12603]|uniref:N-acyl-D-amino-acid deacylase family protein n=1 Tax=Kordiimonas sp. SCSIO 12603 TaxID=2829596 RepID=UPI0021059D84|nr:amidohydrolase family protein [Kordiimonas sp. SCSIO 12603]UTW58277.1 amidohydrolase family protein [Kordiimonas sp. SCSIO 12603]
MAFDLLIKNGTIYDGNGGEAYKADIAVKDGIIAEIGDVSGSATKEIDASGHIVTPGFIDIHTHYDGQVSWDANFEPSVNHGVTTAVMGSCGVGFAPVLETDHEKLVRLMEGVEDIPGTALFEGLTWEWESFPEYMNAIDFPHTIDFAAQVVHDPLRVYVMGDRAVFDQNATDEDIARMRDLTREALEAGAVGFSTGRSDVHRSADGQWTPASEASAKELMGIASAFDGLDHGVLQAVNDFDLEREDAGAFDREFDLLEEFVDASGGRPFSISLMQRDFAPQQWHQIIDRVEKANDKGMNMRMQVAPRGIGVILGLQCTFHPFIGFPSYKKISHLSLEERVAIMRDPEFKAQLLNEKSEKMAGDGTPIPPLTDTLLAQIELIACKMFLLGENPDYEQSIENSIYKMAHNDGVPVLSKIYDLLLKNDGREFIYFPIYNYTDLNYKAVHQMMSHPKALLGLTDGGAHVGTVCDASFPTYLLCHWTRDRQQGPQIELPRAIQMLTADVADYAGFDDRGRLEVGKKANINVIDHANIRLYPPKMVQDLPAGGQRLLQDAKGYKATIVAGDVVVENDQLTGALPGRLVRLGNKGKQAA